MLAYTGAIGSLSQTTGERDGSIVGICGHLGNVMSPYFFPDSDGPRFTMAMILQIVFAGLTFYTALGRETYFEEQNRKLKSASDESGVMYNPFTK